MLKNVLVGEVAYPFKVNSATESTPHEKGAGEFVPFESKGIFWTVPAPKKGISAVYFVRIGKRVKIGFSTDVESRLRSFVTGTSEEITLLLTIPGDVTAERRLHDLLAECRVRNEFFQMDYRLGAFLRLAGDGQLDEAWNFLEETTPARRSAAKAERQARRIAARRQSKAELDAYYAGLVAERKRRTGL